MHLRYAKMGLSFLVNHKDFISQQTYGDEVNKKNKFRIILDGFCHILKYGEVNQFYYAYGLDQKGAQANDYMAYSEFMGERNRMNYTRPFDYLCILRDKNIFSIVAEAFNISAPLNIGLLCNGVFSSNQKILGENDLWGAADSIFIKAISGECGQRVFSVKKM